MGHCLRTNKKLPGKNYGQGDLKISFRGHKADRASRKRGSASTLSTDVAESGYTDLNGETI